MKLMIQKPLSNITIFIIDISCSQQYPQFKNYRLVYLREILQRNIRCGFFFHGKAVFGYRHPVATVRYTENPERPLLTQLPWAKQQGSFCRKGRSRNRAKKVQKRPPEWSRHPTYPTTEYDVILLDAIPQKARLLWKRMSPAHRSRAKSFASMIWSFIATLGFTSTTSCNTTDYLQHFVSFFLLLVFLRVALDVDSRLIFCGRAKALCSLALSQGTTTESYLCYGCTFVCALCKTVDCSIPYLGETQSWIC